MVFWRNLHGNSIRIFIQPTFFLLLFGIFMPKLGLFDPNYGDILLPGILAISAMSASAFGVGALVGLSFFREREIKAHILAPISMHMLVFEKLLYGIFQATVSAVIMLGMAFLLLPDSFILPNPFLFLAIIILTSITFASFGIAVASRTRRPPIMFEVLQLVILPLYFFGATFFPLSQVRELSPLMYKALHLLPNVYTAEGLRALLTPHIPHLPLSTVFIGLSVWCVPVFLIGVREFRKRAIS